MLGNKTAAWAIALCATLASCAPVPAGTAPAATAPDRALERVAAASKKRDADDCPRQDVPGFSGSRAVCLILASRGKDGWPRCESVPETARAFCEEKTALARRWEERVRLERERAKEEEAWRILRQ